jgi:hypothetical protein
MKRLPRTTPDTSEIRLRSLVIAFVGMLCATVIGFVSEIRPLSPNSPDYGYDEAPATEISSLSSATLPSNCDDHIAAVSDVARDGLGPVAVSAIAAPPRRRLRASSQRE